MNLKLSNIILTVISILLLISCQKERQLQLETVKYKQLSFVEGWGDSIFLSKVRDLQFYENRLYISDQYLSQVIETNQYFILNRFIGSARICRPVGRFCPIRRWRSVFSLSLGYRFKMSDEDGRRNPALRQVRCCPGIFPAASMPVADEGCRSRMPAG